MATDDGDSGSDEPGLLTQLVELGIAAATGLPPQVQRSLFKVLHEVLLAAAQVPIEFFQGRAKTVKAQANFQTARINAEAADILSQQKARSLVDKESAKAAALRFSQPELADRAVEFHAAHVLRKQTRMEQIVESATEELKENPPSEDAERVIEDDILEAILREGSRRSSDDFKTFFGRVLAGEIKRPGSFSIGTIQSLGRLTQETATTFQTVCNISMAGVIEPKIITDPFGQAGNNSLHEFGLNYSSLTRLVEEGLLRTEFNEWREITPNLWKERFLLDCAGTKALLIEIPDGLKQPPSDNLRLSGPSFTMAGKELRSIVLMEPNMIYFSRLSKWFKDENGLRLCFMSKIEGDKAIFTPIT